MTLGKLEDLCTINPETLGSGTPADFRFRYIDISAVAKGTIDWEAVQEVEFGEAPSRARRILKSGDVIFSTVRPGLQAHGRVQSRRADMVCSTGFAVLRPIDPDDSSFIFHQVLSDSIARQVRALETGSNYPAVNERDLRNIRFVKPDLGERRRIASVLDTVDALIESSEAVLAKLRQVRAGLLHDLLTRGLDADGQLRDPDAHPEQFKDSPLGRIPREWEIEPLGRLFEMQLGKMLNPSAKGGRDSRPYLGNRHVLWERVDVSNLEYMDFSDEERAKFSLESGDLLVCEGGEVGRTAIWRGELSECYFQKAIHRLRPKDGLMVPEFMLAFMVQAAVRNAWQNLISQTSISHLTQEKLAMLLVTRPSLEEQNRIASVIGSHDRLISSEQSELSKLRHLKSGLMTDLLEGRVRVPEELQLP